MSAETKVSLQSVITMLINKAECGSDPEVDDTAVGRDGVFIPLPIEVFHKITHDIYSAGDELIKAATDARDTLHSCIDALSSEEQDDHDALSRLDAALARVGGAS